VETASICLTFHLLNRITVYTLL